MFLVLYEREREEKYKERLILIVFVTQPLLFNQSLTRNSSFNDCQPCFDYSYYQHYEKIDEINLYFAIINFSC